MSSYYPSCVVHLTLRFDEALTLEVPPTASSIDELLENPTNTPQPTTQPLILQRGDKNVVHIVARVPKKASIELPGYRQAGQFTLDFDFRELPIDPRTLRAVAVEIHIGSVSAEDFAAGINGQRRADGTLRSILETRTVSGARAETLVISGTADTWENDADETGTVISIRGRDMRGILLDTPLNSALLNELDWGVPLDELIVQILDLNPLFEAFTLEMNPAEWPNGIIPSPGAPGVIPAPRRGARGRRRGGRQTPAASSNSLNFWDIIVRACYLVGAIPYFQGVTLRVRPVHSLYDQRRAGIEGDPTNPTPFAGGQRRTRDEVAGVELESPLAVRRLVYGRDTKTFKVERKFAGFQRPRVVRAVSEDIASTARGASRLLQAQWPPADEITPRQRRTRVSPGGDTAHEEVLNIPVPGIRDVTRLQEIARAVYEEIGRGEVGGSCTTPALASFGGSNADPDLTRLRPGDGVEFVHDVRAISSTPPLASTLTDHYRRPFEEQVAEVERVLGPGSNNLARVIVATSRGQVRELQRFFRVHTVKFTWAHGAGLGIEFDFQNYIEVNPDLTNPGIQTDPGTAHTRTVAGRRRS